MAGTGCYVHAASVYNKWEKCMCTGCGVVNKEHHLMECFLLIVYIYIYIHIFDIFEMSKYQTKP